MIIILVMLVLNDMKDIGHQQIQELDIRGKVCPMTFVYTKLKLEEMKSGELLKVILKRFLKVLIL